MVGTKPSYSIDAAEFCIKLNTMPIQQLSSPRYSFPDAIARGLSRLPLPTCPGDSRPASSTANQPVAAK